jgi:hypothetical protein
MRLGWTAAAWGKDGDRSAFRLCSSAALGMFISPRLPPAHRARETIEMMTLAIGMLVTFAALVLGLITASVKTGYDDAVHYRQEYALQLTELDRCLRNYGSGADAAGCCACAASGHAAAERGNSFDECGSSHCRPQGSKPLRTMLWNDLNYSRDYDWRNGAQPSFCAATILRTECPLWVISRHLTKSGQRSALRPESGHR